MDFFNTFLSLIAIVTIVLPIGFMSAYRETKSKKWLFFSIFCCLILIVAFIYLNIFAYFLSIFKVSTDNPILEFASIFIVLVVGIYYLKES